MGRLTKEQIEFAKSMTIKQRRVLQSLAMFPFYQSPSEHADAELADLFRYKLVQASRCLMRDSNFDGGHPSWGATHAGKLVAEKIRAESI